MSSSTATPAAPAGRLRPGLLALAIMIMLGTSIYPNVLASAACAADHWAATALFWAMSTGFISGVGFRPRHVVWRTLFSPASCLLALTAGLARLWLIG